MFEENIYERTSLLLGQENMARLRKAKVLVAGLGGVGAYACEALVRAGVGQVIVFDGDVVSPSNINRQLIALNSTIGQSKAKLIKQRMKDINPDCQITAIDEFVKDERMSDILTQYQPDWVVDAIDTLSPKIFLLIHCYKLSIKTVSSMGSGGKINPSLIQIDDISQTYNCPLASHIRKHLHKVGIYNGITAVFSAEKVMEGSTLEQVSQNKRTTVGTISYMPPIFGLMAASVVIRELLGIEAYKRKEDKKYYQDKKSFKL